MKRSSAAKPRVDFDADWDVRATQSAIAAAREVIGDGINGRAMISSLSELEWGWICSAAIFAWIKTKAMQATADGGGYDVIHEMPGNPPPWDAGALAAVLPQLGKLEGIDWGKPVGEWSKDEIVSFVWQAHQLAGPALSARDLGAKDKITRTSQAETERELSAANGGPLMARGELNDIVPF